jgi:hypothetical protein
MTRADDDTVSGRAARGRAEISVVIGAAIEYACPDATSTREDPNGS